MALINCSECGKKVSEKAIACPSCGNPIFKQKGKVIIYGYSGFFVGNPTIKVYIGNKKVGEVEKDGFLELEISKDCKIFFKSSSKSASVEVKSDQVTEILLSWDRTFGNLIAEIKNVKSLENGIVESTLTYKENSNIDESNNTNDTNNNTVNSQPNVSNRNKTGCMSVIFVIVIIIIGIFLFKSCFNSIPMTEINYTIEKSFNNVTNVVCSSYGSSDDYNSYDCNFKAGGLQVRYEVCVLCSKKGSNCYLGSTNLRCKDYKNY